MPILRKEGIYKTMIMKQLIELGDSYIKCDNPVCNYTHYVDDKISDYLNVPCPECGQNLLTTRDFDAHLKFVKLVTWINKWFGWLTIFIHKPHYKDVSIHFHEDTFTIKSEDE